MKILIMHSSLEILSVSQFLTSLNLERSSFLGCYAYIVPMLVYFMCENVGTVQCIVLLNFTVKSCYYVTFYVGAF
jgi:hypothetical protein